MSILTIGAAGIIGGKQTHALPGHDEIIRIHIADEPENQMPEHV